MEFETIATKPEQSGLPTAVLPYGGDSVATRDPPKSPEEILAGMGFHEEDSESVRKFVRGDTALRIELDDEPRNPREYDNMSIIALHPNCGYDFGDEVSDTVPDDSVAIFPLYAYIHSGIVLGMDAKEFPDMMWDVSLVGFIYATNESMQRCFGDERLTLDSIRKVFQEDINQMNKYLAGESYCFIIERTAECNMHVKHVEVVDSCHGIDDLDYAIRSATECL